jgi:hypothetical protein
LFRNLILIPLGTAIIVVKEVLLVLTVEV